MKPVSAILHLSKTTQGTYVYMEDTALARESKTFPTIYVQKHALTDPPPKRIRVTIEEEPS